MPELSRGSPRERDVSAPEWRYKPTRIALERGPFTTLCPVTTASVNGSTVAFLRPESASGSAGCPAGSLNGSDADTTDTVVSASQNAGAPQNFKCAATAVALSSTHVAALVSEAAQGDGSLNAPDGDSADTIVKVRRLTDPVPATCSAWTNTGEAADAVALTGSWVAFTQPEAAQNGADQTGDLADDRVMKVFDAATGTGYDVLDASLRAQPVEDFVLGAEAMAFRTREGDYCNVTVDATNCDPNPPGCPLATCDVNGDGDCCDDVMQGFDLAKSCVGGPTPGAACVDGTTCGGGSCAPGGYMNCGQAMTPCLFAACDPRRPYRLAGPTVKYLSYECQQGGAVTAGCPGGGTDLNDDGDAGDLVIQVCHLRTGEAVNVGTVVDPSGVLIDPLQGDPVDACLTGVQGGTQIFLSTGRCIETLGGARSRNLLAIFPVVCVQRYQGRCSSSPVPDPQRDRRRQHPARGRGRRGRSELSVSAVSARRRDRSALVGRASRAARRRPAPRAATTRRRRPRTTAGS
jgi:hypothetical protein